MTSLIKCKASTGKKDLKDRCDLCNYSDAYIVVKGTINVTRPNNNNAYDKNLAFKSSTPCIGCIIKINNTLIDRAEDLNIVMVMHNLIEHSKNYSKTSGSLWNYIEMNQIVLQKDV